MGNVTTHIAVSEKGFKQQIPTDDKPVLFLAGPIRNAPPWHNEAIRIVHRQNDNVFIAAPIRRVEDDIKPLIETHKPDAINLPRQRGWEIHYLYQAAKKGCIVFWLPAELPITEFEGKIYAHITMMELGGWIARKKIDDSINLVIGTDGNFPEWETVKFDIENETPNVPICYSLEETILTALNKIKNK